MLFQFRKIECFCSLENIIFEILNFLRILNCETVLKIFEKRVINSLKKTFFGRWRFVKNVFILEVILEVLMFENFANPYCQRKK